MPSIGYKNYLALLVALAACHSVHVHALGGAGQSTASDDNTPPQQPPVTATVARRAAASDDNTTTCPSGLEPGNYEFAAGKGKNGQGVSYGIPMMQADKLAAVADKGNVLFCLALMGYDERNKDLPKGIKGCEPGTPRTPGGPPRECFQLKGVTTWGSGMAALSILGALDNAIGVKGIMPDASVYIYSVYNTSISSNAPEPTGGQLVAAFQDCEAELDARKANRIPGTPNLNMVVIQDSFMSAAAEGVDVLGAYLKSVKARRNDIMFLSGAWATLENDTVVDSFPSAFPEFLAIASVGVNFTSTSGSDPPVNFTAFSAPGEYIMWTASLREYSWENLNVWGQRKNSITAKPPLADVQDDFWESPPPGTFAGAAVGSISAELMDCGIGMSPCGTNATGKICVIQRGGGTFAEKVNNCINSGGVAVVIYARDDQDPCQRLTGNLLDVVVNDTVITGPLPGGAWPIALGLSLQQGKALLSAMAAGKVTSLTLKSPARTPTPLPLTFSTFDYYNGNNFYAAVMASGAFGALWSAHSSCSAQQIVDAVAATVKPKVDSSLAEWELKARYGKGLVQVWDAHNYLLTNPCKPIPVLTITTTLNSKIIPKDNNDKNAAGQHFGGRSFFKITVVARDPVTHNVISNVPVTLTLDPSGLVKCGKVWQRHTGWKVGAVWSCSRVKGATGMLTIKATSAETAWYAAAKSQITVLV